MESDSVQVSHRATRRCLFCPEDESGLFVQELRLVAADTWYDQWFPSRRQQSCRPEPSRFLSGSIQVQDFSISGDHRGFGGDLEVRKVSVMNSSPLIVLARSRAFAPAQTSDKVLDRARRGCDGSLGSNCHRCEIPLRGSGWRQRQQFVRMVGEADPAVATWIWDWGGHLLSWALLHKGCEAIVDDRATRNCARSLGIPM